MLLAQWFTALGTVGAVILALWGEWIRDKLSPARIAIEPHNNLRGIKTTWSNGMPVYFWHLCVVNKTRSRLAVNSRVMLVRMEKRLTGGQFQQVPLAIPLPFIWAPAEANQRTIAIPNSAVLDLGSVSKGEPPQFGGLAEFDLAFVPALQTMTNDFAGIVQGSQTFRYIVEPVSDTHRPKSQYAIEMEWDGQWHDEESEMNKHLVVRLFEHKATN